MERQKIGSIDLSDYGKKIKDFNSIKKLIQEELDPKLFEITDFQTLLYESFLLIKDISDVVENESTSIENAAKMVADKLQITSESSKNPMEFYKIFLLGFDQLPADHYRHLEYYVRNHLTAITELIYRYNKEEPFIEKHLAKGIQPRSNQERMLHDFFYRCLQEQQKILDYYLFGVKERARQKATAVHKGFTNLMRSFDWLYDYPYKYNMPYAVEYFDYRKINQASHRLAEFKISIGDQLLDTYVRNKERFYEELFRAAPHEAYWQSIKFYLTLIPQVKDRGFIFDELERLFTEQRWLAFYALALPQVEGLFTDMIAITHPKRPAKSLSEKVDMVRPLYSLSEAYFDYYQYIVPELRNKFAHTGHETENFKLMAFDLLTDLDHILRVYSSLENPYIELEKIYKTRNRDDFTRFEHFSNYFNMLKRLKKTDPERHKEALSKHKKFEEDFLIPHCDFDYICFELLSLVPREVSLVVNTFTLFDLREQLPKEIQKAIQNSEVPKKLYSHYETHQVENIRVLRELESFITGIGAYMSVTTKQIDSVKSLVETWKKEAPTLKNIFAIDALCRKRLEDKVAEAR